MRTRVWAPALSLAVVAGLLVVLSTAGRSYPARVTDDLAQFGAAACAALAGYWRSRRTRRRTRLGWLFIAAGAGSWAIGQAIWSGYELIGQVQTPFPSLADVGFLLLPVLASAGILARPSDAFAGRAGIRIVLDVALVVTSLFTLSWSSALGTIYRSHDLSAFARMVSLAYPATDVAMLTVVVVVLGYARGGRRTGLVWLAAALATLAVADSGFAYLTAIGRYHTGDVMDACWVGGFLLLACSAVLDRGEDELVRETQAPPGVLLLPYVPAVVGVVIALWQLPGGSGDRTLAVSAAIVVTLLGVRQVAILLDNRNLLVRVRFAVLHDAVTGLANRTLFTDRLAHALDLHRRDLRPVAVLLIDLDDFAVLNEELGYGLGDEVLVRVSERLVAAVRTGDTVARLGADRFAVLMEDGGDALELAHRVQSGLDHPVAIGRRSRSISAGIGVVSLPSTAQGLTGTELMRRADLACYAAKHAGPGSVCGYAPSLVEFATGEMDLRVALAEDLDAGRLTVAFQPVYLPGGQLHAVEALARWSYMGEAVPPEVFLPIARRLDMCTALDEYVVRTAVYELARWSGTPLLMVNLDNQTLLDELLVERIDETLRGAQFAPSRLAVGVRESGVTAELSRASGNLDGLRRLGVRIGVDGFGAGYGSLARLEQLRPDILKIDRSLVGHAAGLGPATDVPVGHSLLGGVVRLAHEFGAFVVAAGIESDADRASAMAAGCDALQGFLLGGPEPADRCRALVDAL